jgi:hypothetical protein
MTPGIEGEIPKGVAGGLPPYRGGEARDICQNGRRNIYLTEALMTARRCFAGLLLSLVLVQTGRADEKAAVKKVEAADAAAMAAYRSGDAQRAKDTLLEAIVLGKENALETHPVMARVYLHLGAVQVEGLKDEEKARRYFGLALRIQPDIKATDPVATPIVVRALERARDAGKEASAAAAPAPAADLGAAESQERARQAESAAAQARAREKMTAAVLKEKERETLEKEQKAREERDRLGKDLAAVQDREKQERQAREKLEKDKQDLEKQLADIKDREKKEREEKERLQKANQELEKQLAGLRDTEKKERQAREQLQAQERERQDRASQEKMARDRLADGPDMPGSIPQPVYCPTPDEWASGTDVYVHCAPQGEVKAKELALYYRPSGTVHYNSLLMERSKKGWYVATIPSARVSGRMLQYYVEARGAKGDVAAANGKANSPNVMMIRPGAGGQPTAAAQSPKLTSAAATTPAKSSSKSRAGRRKSR